MGPLCCLVALGHGGMTYLNFFLAFFFFFFGPIPPPLSLATFTAASHFTVLSLWDYTTKISLCLTNCCHDNGRGAVCERDVSVIVCLIANLGAMCAFHVCVQSGHVSGLFFFLLTC